MKLTQEQVSSVWDRLDSFGDKLWHPIQDITDGKYSYARISESSDLKQGIDLMFVPDSEGDEAKSDTVTV